MTPAVAFSDPARSSYELFVTNLTPTPMTLRRVEVVAGEFWRRLRGGSVSSPDVMGHGIPIAPEG